jgi:AcrR family transcriptional regulator
MENSKVGLKRKQRPARILDAAARLVIHYGFDKTTMDDIAREAGVSKGALYLEWSSREALFDALFEHEMKKLLLDLRSRVELDADGGTIASLYGHTLLALQHSPLISALYTRDGRILGDYIHRQDPDRYTRRLLMGRESVQAMQAAGLLRKDFSAEVISHLFSLMALGMLSISGVIPEQNSPPIQQTVEGMAAVVQAGLALPGGDSALLKQTTLNMLDLMLAQYDERGKNED